MTLCCVVVFVILSYLVTFLIVLLLDVSFGGRYFLVLDGATAPNSDFGIACGIINAVIKIKRKNFIMKLSL